EPGLVLDHHDLRDGAGIPRHSPDTDHARGGVSYRFRRFLIVPANARAGPWVSAPFRQTRWMVTRPKWPLSERSCSVRDGDRDGRPSTSPIPKPISTKRRMTAV